MKGRALVPDRERQARAYTADVVERSTLPRAEIAQHYRRGVAVAVDRRQYRYAGFVRRVAELLEGALFVFDSDLLEILELYRQLAPEQQADFKDLLRRLIRGDQS
jgi:hypothetical protein